MRNTRIPPTLACALGTALCAAALIAARPVAAGPSTVVAMPQTPGGRLMVRFVDPPAAPGRARALRAEAGTAGQWQAIVKAAMVRAGVAPQATPGAWRRTAGATPEARHVRRLAVGAALIQLPGVRDPADLQRVADALAQDPGVAYAVVDRRRHAFALPTMLAPPSSDPGYGTQWHWHDPVGGIDAPRAWQRSRGEGVVVAVLDTGILPHHPDFADSRLLPGYDFISDPAVSRRAGFGRVPGALDQGDWHGVDECVDRRTAEASTWHGTQVAAAIAESGGNGLGMTGLAPSATLLPVRVVGRCGGDDSDLVDAIAWASGGHVDGVPDNEHPAEVINLSLGSAGACPAPLQEAIAAAIARGALVVAAAGNASADADGFAPGNCPGVLDVGATRITGEISPFSNHGARVDLAAPGGNDEGQDGPLGASIWQAGYSGPTTPTSGRYIYGGTFGTSMAAPQVSATAALVQSARVAAGRDPLAPARLKALLVETARPFPGVDPQGRMLGSGIVNPGEAIARAVDPACDPGKMSCKPSTAMLRNQVAAVVNWQPGGVRFVFTARAGVPLNVMSYGGTGNASLYVRYGLPATESKYDGRSTGDGNTEVVRLLSPKAGTYHVWLPGDPAYRQVSVLVRQ